jgi:hypothetical protein
MLPLRLTGAASTGKVVDEGDAVPTPHKLVKAYHLSGLDLSRLHAPAEEVLRKILSNITLTRAARVQSRITGH